MLKQMNNVLTFLSELFRNALILWELDTFSYLSMQRRKTARNRSTRGFDLKKLFHPFFIHWLFFDTKTEKLLSFIFQKTEELCLVWCPDGIKVITEWRNEPTNPLNLFLRQNSENSRRLKLHSPLGET